MADNGKAPNIFEDDAADALDFLDECQRPSVQMRDWMADKRFVLGTEENLAGIIDECIAAPRFALDLETSGLDNRVLPFGDGSLRTVDHIAGACLSPDGVTGYYIPLRHVIVSELGDRTPHPANVPWAAFEREMRRLVGAVEAGEAVAVFHNGKFDQEFLQFHGGEPLGTWDRPSQWEDTLILAYLGNSRARRKGLKWLSKERLDIEQVELDELFPPDTPKHERDFSVLDPTDQGVLWYGGGDGICTYLLYDELAPAVLEKDTDGRAQRLIYQIEKGCVAATRWMERNQIHVDMDVVRELITLGQQEWFDSIMAVYGAANKILGRNVMPGKYRALQENFQADDAHRTLPAQLKRAESRAKADYPDPKTPVQKENKTFPPIYDVNAPKQLGQMFDEMGVPNLVRTEKTGQVKTTKQELERVIEQAGQKFPFMRLIRRFRETSKALTNYLFPMLLDCDPEHHTMRINFNGQKVDTGRFSTPAKDGARSRMSGWPSLNFQSIPATYDPHRPACMTRLRECITARKPDTYIVAIDFAGVELRIVTNLSMEPLWLNEFFHCASCDRIFPREPAEGTPLPPPARCPNCGSDKIGDLHTLTALSIYGEDAPSKDNWKALRGYAKNTNFALSYGGGGMAVARSTGVDKNEGWRIANAFNRTYKGLKRWWNHQHRFAKEHGFVRTAFGRKYPVPDINNPDRGFAEKAKRNSINGPIQGTSADITKTAMFLVYREMKKRGWLDKVRMIVTMHDELVFEMDGDVMEEAIAVIIPLMTRNKSILARQWPIPLTCDVEVGHNWTVPWDLNEMRHGEVKFIGDKKVKGPDKVPEGCAWEDLDCWPDELKRWFQEASGGAAPASPLPQAPPPPQSPPPSTPSGKTPQSTARAVRTPKTTSSGICERRLSAPLTMGTVWALASVLAKCKDRGTKVLRLLSPDGDPLDLKAAFGEEVRVSDVTFNVLADDKGL